MTVSDQYLRNVSPQLQNSGSDVGRQPILNVGTGLTLTAEPGQSRNTIAIDPTELNQITQFTSSINNVTMYNSVTPQYAQIGTIAPSETKFLVIKLKERSHSFIEFRATTRDGLSASLFSKSLVVLATDPIFGDAIIDFESTGSGISFGDSSPSGWELSSSISGGLTPPEVSLSISSSKGGSNGYTLMASVFEVSY